MDAHREIKRMANQIAVAFRPIPGSGYLRNSQSYQGVLGSARTQTTTAELILEISPPDQIALAAGKKLGLGWHRLHLFSAPIAV